MGSLEPWGAVAAIIVSILAVLTTSTFAIIRFRREDQRRDDVLAWGIEAIGALKTLDLICSDEDGFVSNSDDKIESIYFDTSILIERGRLFFRNVEPSSYGDDKEGAYQGYRPRILDPLLVAHQIASAWTGANEPDRVKMRKLARKYHQKFVSLAQQEVGRARSRASDPALAGDSIRLRALLDAMRTESLL